MANGPIVHNTANQSILLIYSLVPVPAMDLITPLNSKSLGNIAVSPVTFSRSLVSSLIPSSIWYETRSKP